MRKQKRKHTKQMDVRPTNHGLGLYATKYYAPQATVFVLTGPNYAYPTRETIYVGNNVHVDDPFGRYINHAFTPNTYIRGGEVVALVPIAPDTELTFNYNENEINMAAPFYVDNILVQGKNIK